MSSDPYPLFTVFAFLGFLVSVIPLPWHLEAWNSATCYYMGWTALACLNQFINSIVWSDSVQNFAPVWCDISTRIMIGASVGIPASGLCIMLRLFTIARVQAVTSTRSDKIKAVFIDSAICVLFPMITMALAYVVQGHRFDIFEDIGCYPVVVNTALSYVLVYMWPVLCGVVSAVFCVLSIRIFARRRAELSEFMANNKSLTMGRYVRLMALAMVNLLLTVPLSVYVIVINATTGTVEPWVSWTDTHFGFSRVNQIPSALWRTDHGLVLSLELSRWLNPASAFVFFAFFGFATEAMKTYRKAYLALARRLGFQSSSATSTITSFSLFSVKAKDLFSSHGSLPVYVQAPRPPPSSSFASSYSLPASEKTAYSPANSTKVDIPSVPSTPTTPSSAGPFVVDMVSLPFVHASRRSSNPSQPPI